MFGGLLITLAAFAAALVAFNTSQAVSTALAPITGLIGTIVGAYFGIQKGAEGTEAAEEGRQRAEMRAEAAEDKATKLAGAVPDARMVAWALETELPPRSPEPPAAERAT